MINIELQIGESISITGQKSTHLIVANVDGEIFTRTDSNRDKVFTNPKEMLDYIKEEKPVNKTIILDERDIIGTNLPKKKDDSNQIKQLLHKEYEK